MSIIPPRLLQCNITDIIPNSQWNEDDGTGDPWIGVDYRWQITLYITPQIHSSHLTSTPYSYDGLDMKIGDWIVCQATGFAFKIVQIISQGVTDVTCIAEDVDRFNTFTDSSGLGTGAPNLGSSLIFELSDDGLPVLGPSSSFSSFFGANLAMVYDIVSRFRYRNLLKTYYRVYQPGHSLNIGNLVYLDSSSTYQKAIATSGTTSIVIGQVNSVGIPGQDWFTYLPVGRINNAIVPTLPGNPGSFVYLDNAITGGYTNIRPNSWTKPVYIKINNTTGVFLDRNYEVENNGYSTHCYEVDTISQRDALIVNPGDQAFVKDTGQGEWGHYIRSMSSWIMLTNQDASTVDSRTKSITLTFANTGPQLISRVSTGTKIINVTISVEQSFDDINSVLTVGDNSNNSRFMEDYQNNLNVVGEYFTTPAFQYPEIGTETEIFVYVNFGTSTTGVVTITITYN